MLHSLKKKLRYCQTKDAHRFSNKIRLFEKSSTTDKSLTKRVGELSELMNASIAITKSKEQAIPKSINLPKNLNISENTALTLGIRPEHFGPQYENKIKGKISFVETQGREDLYDVNFNDHLTIRSIQPSENRVELHSEVNWEIMTEGILLFDNDGKRL